MPSPHSFSALWGGGSSEPTHGTHRKAPVGQPPREDPGVSAAPLGWGASQAHQWGAGGQGTGRGSLGGEGGAGALAHPGGTRVGAGTWRAGRDPAELASSAPRPTLELDGGGLPRLPPPAGTRAAGAQRCSSPTTVAATIWHSTGAIGSWSSHRCHHQTASASKGTQRRSSYRQAGLMAPQRAWHCLLRIMCARAAWLPRIPRPLLRGRNTNMLAYVDPREAAPLTSVPACGVATALTHGTLCTCRCNPL